MQDNMSLQGVESSERRRYQRLVRKLPVYFNIYEDKRNNKSHTRFSAQTQDIGLGGVAFDTIIEDITLAKELTEKRTGLNLNIHLIEKNSEIASKANIAWIFNLKGLPIKTKYVLGLNFVDMGKAERDILSTYLNEMISFQREESAKNRQRIKKTLAQIARVNENSFSEDTLIREELGVDSLMAMETLAVIETIYGIEIDESRAFDVVTVADMMDLIEEYLHKNSTY
ncbi:MAG: phosphopantetheine-binding protein [bacterium]